MKHDHHWSNNFIEGEKLTTENLIKLTKGALIWVKSSDPRVHLPLDKKQLKDQVDIFTGRCWQVTGINKKINTLHIQYIGT